jgi:integrase
VEPSQALSRSYAGLRSVCLLSPLTARTYLNYAIGGLRLSPALREVREVRKLANRLAAVEAPVHPVTVMASDDPVLAIARMPSGPEKRAAVLMLSTGARCADVAKLQADEIVVEDSTHARPRLQIAWCETKARKDYGARITISDPSALVGTILSGMLLEMARARGAPCPGVTAHGVNRALKAVGSKASTRSFRVAFVSRAREHLDATESARSLSTLTGHYSDAVLSAVYERHAVLARSRLDRQKRERTVTFLGEEREPRPGQPSREPALPPPASPT